MAMKVLVTANQKGGVGKTSTLVHLAFDFSERGKRVAVIDMDTQGNASFTLNQFSSGIKANEMWGEIKPTRVTQIPESGISLIESDIQLANVEKLNLSEMVKQFRHNLQQLANSGFDVCLMVRKMNLRFKHFLTMNGCVNNALMMVQRERHAHKMSFSPIF
ncbi:protein IncC [Escherichia coli M056]|uniref:ParA family protein n=1 Tax=Escherichia coli TaxID=562 RepID=UPI000A18461C|nr:ParA family protein [Escherichia coli]OSK13659.1 protein IncC [Escherichia coli M056]